MTGATATLTGQGVALAVEKQVHNSVKPMAATRQAKCQEQWILAVNIIMGQVVTRLPKSMNFLQKNRY